MRWIFFISWWYCFIIFPTWYIFPGAQKYYVFLFLFFYFLLNGYLLFRWMESPKRGKRDVFKPGAGLIALLLIGTALQIYPMNLPIETVGDEHYHSYAAIPVLAGISSKVHISFPLLGWIVGLIIGGVVWYLQSTFRKIKTGRVNTGVSLIVVFTILYVFLLERAGIFIHLPPLKHLIRFPPLGKTVNLLFYALLGVNEFTARLPQLIFYLMTSVYLYRLLLLFRDKETAVVGSAFFLFLPVFFYYGHMAYLTAGAIFLVVCSIFYFLRYIKEGEREDFIIALFLSSIGFLYKRVLLVLLLTFFLYLLLKTIISRDLPDGPSFYLRSFWVGLVPVIPWSFLSYRFSERNYSFILSNWFSWESALFVLRQMPQAITYPVFLLFIFGVIYSLWKKRDELTHFSLLWFFSFYVFINSDWCRSVRLALPLYVAVAIITVQFICAILPGKRVVFLSIFSVVPLYLLLASLLFNFYPLQSKYTLLTNLKNGYVPYPEAMKYIKEYLPKGSRIYAPMGCEPSHFYLYRYGLEGRVYWGRKIWIEDKTKQSLENLYQFCKTDNFEYLLLPDGKWIKNWINPEISEGLFRGEDMGFEKVEIFRYGMNKMILCSVK
ncbi:MAG TPA: hypothetical protein EYP78_04360 [Candidatus Omnitrophica bacterium]|nr:hypothetical protein [Candidatus Omnitrophota bacterium]